MLVLPLSRISIRWRAAQRRSRSNSSAPSKDFLCRLPTFCAELVLVQILGKAGDKGLAQKVDEK